MDARTDESRPGHGEVDGAAAGASVLPDDLLRRRDLEGARWLALARLRELDTVRPRLRRTPDAEALHDFRVALRRLRSVLRAYRDALDDSVSARLRRRLASLARATSAPRDAEVHRHWLAHQRERLAADERQAADCLERRLSRDERSGGARLRRELDDHYASVVRRLDRRLRHYRVAFTLDEPAETRLTSALVAGALGALVANTRARLRKVRSMDDARALHQARVAVKRLRYALEPLADARVASAPVSRVATAAVARLRSLQDDLGQVHDAHVFGGWLADRAAEAAARDARMATEAAAHQASSGEAPVGGGGGATMTAAIVSLQHILRADAEPAYARTADAARRRAIRRMLRSIERTADRLAARA